MFEARNLCYQRGGRQLFSQLSFKLEQGQSLHIKGENGAGKSSLLKLLSGVTRVDHGEVLWQGISISEDELTFHRNLLFIGHKSGINLHLNALENLAWYSSVHGIDFKKDQYNDVFKRFGLYGFEDIPAGKLSAGQQRRIALCRLMFSTQSLWLLDEPLVSLDQAGVQLFQSLLEEHLKKGGLAIFTSHQDLVINDARIEILDLNLFKNENSRERV